MEGPTLISINYQDIDPDKLRGNSCERLKSNPRHIEYFTTPLSLNQYAITLVVN